MLDHAGPGGVQVGMSHSSEGRAEKYCRVDHASVVGSFLCSSNRRRALKNEHMIFHVCPQGSIPIIWILEGTTDTMPNAFLAAPAFAWKQWTSDYQSQRWLSRQDRVILAVSYPAIRLLSRLCRTFSTSSSPILFHVRSKPQSLRLYKEQFQRQMASVLSLTQSSPLSDRYSTRSRHVLERSCSSANTGCTTGTVQHHPPRSLSGSSLSSLTSLWTPAFRRQHDDSTPSRSPSSHNLTLRRIPTISDRRITSDGYSRRASLVPAISSRFRSEPVLGSDHIEERLLEVAESEGEVYSLAEEQFSLHTVEESEHVMTPMKSTAVLEATDAATSPPRPRVRRWISTLRRRKREAPPSTTPRIQRWKLDDFDSRAASPIKRITSHHKQSHSNGSSMGFVTTVKSATATLASVSIATVSGRHAKWRRGHQRSSVISGSNPRASIDSQRSMLDDAAKQRSRKRRAKLEELIRTEENYVADLKSLSNVSLL